MLRLGTMAWPFRQTAVKGHCIIKTLTLTIRLAGTRVGSIFLCTICRYNEQTSLEIFLRSSVFVCVHCEYYSDYLSPAFCTIIICMCRPHKLAITLFILDDKSQMGNSNKYTMIWHKKQQQEHHLPLQPQQHHHLYHHYHPGPLSGHANMQTWLKNGRNQTASYADNQQ